MRPLDDLENPYRDSYAAWDRWSYEHAVKDSSRLYNAEPQPGWVMLSVGVDEQGFPVPLLEASRQEYEYDRKVAEAAGQAPQEQASRCVVSYPAYGEMDPALKEQLDAAQMAVKARYIAKVPRWLAEQPPYWALLLPDGQVVALGEPGTGKGFNLDRMQASRGPFGDMKNDGYSYFLYDGKGKLLKKTEPGKHWIELFWPGFEAKLADGNQNRYLTERMGLVVMQAAFDPGSLAVYDYTGKKLEYKQGSVYAGRDPLVWNGLYGQELELIYKAQQQR